MNAAAGRRAEAEPESHSRVEQIAAFVKARVLALQPRSAAAMSRGMGACRPRWFCTAATLTTRGGCVILTSSNRRETLSSTGNALVVWWTGMHTLQGEVPIPNGVRFNIEACNSR
jgi:hypothetical protein